MKREDIRSFLYENSFIRPEEAEFMYDQLQGQEEKGILLELGTGRGHSTKFFSLALPEWVIFTVDGFGLYGTTQNVYNNENEHSFDPKAVTEIQNHLIGCPDNVIQIIHDTGTLPWRIWTDVVFIDSDHSYEGVRRDVENIQQWLVPYGILFFHDYGTGWPGVKEYIDNVMIKSGYWKLEVAETLAAVRRTL